MSLTPAPPPPISIDVKSDEEITEEDYQKCREILSETVRIANTDLQESCVNDGTLNQNCPPPFVSLKLEICTIKID